MGPCLPADLHCDCDGSERAHRTAVKSVRVAHDASVAAYVEPKLPLRLRDEVAGETWEVSSVPTRTSGHGIADPKLEWGTRCYYADAIRDGDEDPTRIDVCFALVLDSPESDAWNVVGVELVAVEERWVMRAGESTDRAMVNRTRYGCADHIGYRAGHDGKCPICNADLVPEYRCTNDAGSYDTLDPTKCENAVPK